MDALEVSLLTRGGAERTGKGIRGIASDEASDAMMGWRAVAWAEVFVVTDN